MPVKLNSKLPADDAEARIEIIPLIDIMFFLLAAFMLVGRYRRPGVIVASSVVGSLAFVFVFMKIVYVSLPLGVGPFRSVSTWLMAMLGIH